jgi:hypothetical protein
MKNITIPVFFLLFLAFQSCDKIDAPYRETSTSGTVIDENTIVIGGDTIAFGTDSTTAVTKVLLEDYTGHLCGTCPPAAFYLHDSLKVQYGEQLVTMSVHSGGFADTCPTALDCPSNNPPGAFEINYKTDVGNTWTSTFGVTANPIGLINRAGYPSSHKKVYTAWKAAIISELANSPKIKMRMKVLYDASSREVKVAVHSSLLQNVSDSLRLQVVLVEDSIVDWQQWYNHTPQLVPDYVHHDVLRNTFNGNFGDLISTGNDSLGKIFLNGYSLSVKSGWNAQKCKAIAFISGGNYRVIQSEEIHITE